jgi:MFS family permease
VRLIARAPLQAPHAHDRNAALVPVLIGVTMVTGVISSLGAPLIPSVAQALHISLDSAQWSLTAALLSAAVAAPIMGRLGDGPRRRQTIIGGLAIVFAGSIVAGLAQSLVVLVAGRAMQGVGLGLAPVTMAAARDHLPPVRAGAVIGVLSVAGAAAVGAGYPVSGLIASELDVHAAFFFGAVISGAALLAAVVVIPASSSSLAARLDVKGAVTIAAGLIALLLAISQGQQWGWGSPEIVALFAAAIVTLGLWVRMQLAHDAPLVDLRQLRHRAVLTADLAAVVLGVAMYMFLTIVTEFVQEPRTLSYGLGASTLVAGLCLVPFSVMSLLASRTTAWFTRRLSAFATMGVVGVGFGYTFAAIPGLIARAVPGSETGSAMGLYQVIRYIGFSLGSAFVASILAGNTVLGRVSEHGYVTALWVGTAACAISAVVSWLLSRRRETASPTAIGTGERERIALEEAELASAGLVGIEGERATRSSSREA